jgi:hypothetical protein
MFGSEVNVIWAQAEFGIYNAILRGLQSASELYRLSDYHLLAKFSATFCG